MQSGGGLDYAARGSEREGAGRHRAGSQGVQQQGDRRRAVPQRGDGAQLSQRDPRQAGAAGSHPAGGVLLPPPGLSKHKNVHLRSVVQMDVFILLSLQVLSHFHQREAGDPVDRGEA